MKREYNLECQFDTHKSFYGKAVVVVVEGVSKTLYSYDTKVAEITYSGEKTLKIFGFYSSTTLRHIKEFTQQEGFPAMNKKQLSAYEVTE